MVEPVGGMYRKVVIGKEQSHRTSFMTGHLLWQDRLRIEQQQRDKQLKSWHKKLGLYPRDTNAAEGGPGPGFETRMARDRLLWQDSVGPGSRGPNLETLAGRRQAQREGRQKLKILRGLAASMSDASLRPEDSEGGSAADRIVAEVPLTHHEVCHRQAHAPPGPLQAPGSTNDAFWSGSYPDGLGGTRLVAEVPLRDHEVVCRQRRQLGS
mmetsp:Transcript_41284/g.76828  ORF Transcript_41284/g.76828 Transcript_41284/m.76828 type:complete len:210 (-) Transcript_41284:54-683(-)